MHEVDSRTLIKQNEHNKTPTENYDHSGDQSSMKQNGEVQSPIKHVDCSSSAQNTKS